ncbi:MAG: hypothetical protein ACR2RF_28780, partial [Geminicoccaceae bacterium]
MNTRPTQSFISRWPLATLGRNGAVWMLITAFFFVCVHATGKFLLQHYSVVQVVWGRYAFHLLLAILILAPKLGRLVRSTNLKLQLL